MLLVDPTTGVVVRRYPVGGNPQPGIVVGDELWVPNHLESTVSIISVTDGSVRTITVGRHPSALLLVGQDVWVAAFGDGSVTIVPVSS